MDTAPETPQLRSLTIGEIFDRATTLYVRNFGVFSLIVLTLLAPVAVVNYLLSGKDADNFNQILRQIQHPGSVHTAPQAPTAFLAVFGLALLSLLLAPYVNNAVAAGVAMIYRGARPTYGQAFKPVFERGWQLLGTIVLCGLMLLGVYLSLSFVFGFVVILAGIALGTIAQVMIAGIIICVLVVLAALLLFGVVSIFALYATTLENQTPSGAISQAFARLFTRREFPKALLMALSYLALELVTLIVTGSIDVLIIDVVHAPILEIVFATLAGAVLNAFVAVLLAVYYFDVRTRAEGLDLEVDIARLSGAR